MPSVPPDDVRVALRPPQFRLSTLMWGMALLSVFFAVSSSFGGTVSLFVLVVGLAILAHVAGNALGMRLRASGSGPPLTGSAAEKVTHEARYAVSATDFAPVTQLRERRALGWPNLVVTAFGGILAAVLGGYGLMQFYGDRISAVNLVLGMTGCLVLGAIWSFAAGSLFQVAFTTWRQAQRDGRS